MSYDFAPLLRSAIGFDRLARLVDDAVTNAPAHASYPPYNIEKAPDETYRLTMALAGFGPDDVDVYLAENQLVIKGSVPRAIGDTEVLHRGIATRAFERRFALADHIEVTGAEMDNGLLTVSVRQLTPEALKPRRIPIATGRASPATPHAPPPEHRPHGQGLDRAA
ncbi:Hsp20 family protein [Swaminathania salitolerans]|uniref:Heat-shock protein IbpA n=1 Tax=Swaminathania salitolerans TaxID=182838 RepID=A0A511BN81_9PROT|nr:Hsp20 family protein [Swaminathania salitolerans]GBQ13652.1 heat shock protein Hsp20 [Swaminathania salitolerans LMG 21291]GEL01781.1 heat-shock protein IbpA [Swaminathania salitolerans]